MFKNDERYWDINLLNKWFAISSLIFLGTMVWTFIDDNDDEFKDYQKEFRKLQVSITETNLDKEIEEVQDKTDEYDELLARAQEEYNNQSNLISSINDELGVLRAGFYKINLKFAEEKANLDVFKFKLENANTKSTEKASNIKKVYKEKISDFNIIKLEKEDFEIKISDKEKQLKVLKTSIKKIQDERDVILKKVNLSKN